MWIVTVKYPNDPYRSDTSTFFETYETAKEWAEGYLSLTADRYSEYYCELYISEAIEGLNNAR